MATLGSGLYIFYRNRNFHQIKKEIADIVSEVDKNFINYACQSIVKNVKKPRMETIRGGHFLFTINARPDKLIVILATEEFIPKERAHEITLKITNDFIAKVDQDLWATASEKTIYFDLYLNSTLCKEALIPGVAANIYEEFKEDEIFGMYLKELKFDFPEISEETKQKIKKMGIERKDEAKRNSTFNNRIHLKLDSHN